MQLRKKKRRETIAAQIENAKQFSKFRSAE